MRYVSPYKCIHEKQYQFGSQSESFSCTCSFYEKNMFSEKCVSSNRRVKVCHSQSEDREDIKSITSSCEIRQTEAVQIKLPSQNDSASAVRTSENSRSIKKRPDKPLYVPRARRVLSDKLSSRDFGKSGSADKSSSKDYRDSGSICVSSCQEFSNKELLLPNVQHSEKDVANSELKMKEKANGKKLQSEKSSAHHTRYKSHVKLKVKNSNEENISDECDNLLCPEGASVNPNIVVCREKIEPGKSNVEDYPNSKQIKSSREANIYSEDKVKSSESASNVISLHEFDDSENIPVKALVTSQEKYSVMSSSLIASQKNISENSNAACLSVLQKSVDENSPRTSLETDTLSCQAQKVKNNTTNSQSTLLSLSNKITKTNNSAETENKSSFFYSGKNDFQFSQRKVEPDSWESIFDDDGECLHPEAVKELTSLIGNLEVKSARNDYCEFKNEENYSDRKYSEEPSELGNIVELYGFPVEFHTQDLVSALSNFKSEHFIKWVDDRHALAVFSSTSLATKALELDHPFVKIRPISEGIKASKLKAKSCARSFEPVKPRPVTSVALARRLVSGALGLKVSIPKEEREREKKMISDAKEQRRKAAKQRENIWQGVLS